VNSAIAERQDLRNKIFKMGNEIKADISLADPAFSREQTTGHILVVDLSWERLSCAVWDMERGKFVAIESFATGKLQLPGQLLEQINYITANSALLKSTYKKTRILWGGTQYTLIPLELYDGKHSTAYIQFTQSMQAGDSVYSDRLKNLHAADVFAIPSVIKETLNKIFPGHQLNHFLTILIESLLIAYKNSPFEIQTFVHVSAKSFDLILLRQGKLIFCNTFEYRSAEDFLYFLLFSADQLNIKPADLHLTLIGDILKPSAICDLLTKYAGDYSFIPRNKAWECSFVFNDLPGHFYYNLLNIFTCE
jgi:hypothetical protein